MRSACQQNAKSPRRRASALAALWTLLSVCLTGYVMWVEDGRYGQPTKRPPGLVTPEVGAVLDWPVEVERHLQPGRPALLHFFNPDCPCTRFNLDLVRDLSREHGADVTFVLVLEASDATAAPDPIAGLPHRIVVDRGGAIADLAGVYSTPSAVVLDAAHALHYVGNYTKARYCSDPRQQPVPVALAQVTGRTGLEPVAAPVPFGCPLPSDLTDASE